MRFKGERGIALPFTAIFIVVILMAVALTLDLGRFLLLSRQLQNMCDSASLAGASALRKASADPNSVPMEDGTLGGFKQVKPRIRYVLSQFRLNGAEQVTTSMPFGLNVVNSVDDPNFRGETLVTSANPSRLRVTVRRGLYCYDDLGLDPSETKIFFDLEPDAANRYCIANAVEVTARGEDLWVFFARIFGGSALDHISRVARSQFRRAYPLSCGDPPCSEYMDAGGNFLPGVACP